MCMKTRIISAIVGIAIFIVVLAFGFKIPLVLLIALAALNSMAIYEMLNNTGLVTYKPAVIVACVEGALFVLSLIQSNLYKGVKTAAIIYAAYFLFISIFALIKHSKINTRGLLSLLFLPFVLGVAFCGMYAMFRSSLSTYGFNFFLVFVFAWGADTGAYFAGTFFGKHKIAPEISPKKTVEGCVGGVVTAVLLSVVLALVYKSTWNYDVDFLRLCAYAVAFSLVGMVGDLFTSFIKRDCGIKDFGTIMPGHGGVLDRFDSVLFIAPFYFVVALAL